MLGVLGDLVEDIVVWSHGPLREATDNEATVHRTRGGSAANVAAFAAADLPSRFLGCVGADALGDSLVNELRSHGVDVRVQRKGTTGTVIALVDNQGERTMFPDRAASVELRDVDETWTDGVTHLHVPAYAFARGPLITTARELITRIQRADGTVSIDASSVGMLSGLGKRTFFDLIVALRPEILFANHDEASLLDLTNEVPAELSETTIVVKDGPQPTTVRRHNAAPSTIPVPRVREVRDATGAGDAFAAGFLTAHLQGKSWVDACHRGHSTAATILTQPGATSR